MSASTTLLTFASLQNDSSATSDLNNNFSAINTALTNCLATNGQAPNQMQANLDMNSNRLINLPAPVAISEPLRVADATTLNGGGTVTVSQLPIAGTTGQVLTKNSNTNFDVGWANTQPIVTTGKTASITNSLTFSGTDSTTITFQGTDTYVGRATTDTLTNKTLTSPTLTTPVFSSISNSGTLTLPSGTSDTLVARNTTDTLQNKTIDTANNTLKVAGNTITATSGTATVTVPNSTGTLLSTSGATFSSSSNQNPTGTTSTPGVMMGIGSSFTITPKYSGRVVFGMQGAIANSTAGDGATVSLRYGTGTAPSNGAAIAGTVANTCSYSTFTVNTQYPWALSDIVTGLSTGTAYWFDISVAAITGGTATATNVSGFAYEC